MNKMKWVKITPKIKIPEGIQVLCYNKEWIDPDFNPEGTRVGFFIEHIGFTTAHWWDYQDTYMTISSDHCDPGIFSKEILDHIQPTHFMVLPKGPTNE